MDYRIFGCKVNKFYLNRRLSYFAERDVVDDDSTLIATCVVTDRAKSKRLKEAQKLLAAGRHVYLTWCGAFEQGEAIDYDRFFGIYPQLKSYRDQLTLLGEDPSRQTDLGPLGEYELNTELGFGDKKRDEDDLNLYTKKFVVIQSGCDTFCTFCLTIYKRGRQRWRAAHEIIEEIKAFVDQGGKEIVITGVNLASWWASHTRKADESKFSDLLEMILHRTSIGRIRISSLGPEFLDDRFFDLIHDQRFLPHFHVSIQHFDDQVLQLMNRNYDSSVLDHVLSGLRWLDRDDQAVISIGADLIVWFPGETEEAFELMLEAVKQYRITKLHAFPFSPHQKGETVPAGRLPDQLPTEIKKERMRRLLDLWKTIRKEFVKQNDHIKWPVLLEEKKGDHRVGWTPNYLRRKVVWDYQRSDIVVI